MLAGVRRRPAAIAVAGLLLVGAALLAARRWRRSSRRAELAVPDGRARPLDATPPDAMPPAGAHGAALAPGTLGAAASPVPREERMPPEARSVVPLPVRVDPAHITLVLVPGLTLVGGILALTVGAPWLLGRQHFPTPPKQPLFFSHEVHVQQAGLDCAFCHRTADRADTAGFPDVEQCMFCHVVVDDARQAAARAAYAGQIDLLRDAWTARQPIDWVRVHRLPDHTRFPHDAHIQAGVACATCHGAVERMDLAQQVRSLKMSDCVACHQQTAAPTDCATCHY